MSVRILFFAAIREQVGRESLELDAAHIKTVRDAWNHLQEGTPQLANFGPGLLFAINQEYATPDSLLNDGDELAIFPPVSGG
jgi:molybdopterin converting factor subunit 1